MTKPLVVSRREFMLAATSTLLAGSVALPRGNAMNKSPNESTAALTQLSAVDAIGHMTRGELSVERYADALLTRCQERRDLNAFITLEPAKVLAAARECDLQRQRGQALGTLFGLPMPIKDSVNTKDYPTTGGTPALRTHQTTTDAPIVSVVREAGAIVLGKTNLHELSYGWTSNNAAYGAVHNPYDPTRIPGGSSGGTAAAVAARMAPLGLAEDTEGSIRVPAALCGVYGFRPTTGRYSTVGAIPISPLFDQVGPHARTVADLSLFDHVVTGERGAKTRPLRGMRLGIVREYWYTDLDPQVERLTLHALEQLREAGAVLVESSLPALAHLIAATTDQIQNHDVRLALPRYLQEFGANVSFDEVIRHASADIQATFRSDVLEGGANFVSEDTYRAACAVYLPQLRRLYATYFKDNGLTAMIFPTTLAPATVIGAIDDIRFGTHSVPFDVAMARNIAPGSTAGLPGLVLPIGLTHEGLPVSLECDGPAGTDTSILALGASLEKLFGHIPPPPG